MTPLDIAHGTRVWNSCSKWHPFITLFHVSLINSGDHKTLQEKYCIQATAQQYLSSCTKANRHISCMRFSWTSVFVYGVNREQRPESQTGLYLTAHVVDQIITDTSGSCLQMEAQKRTPIPPLMRHKQSWTHSSPPLKKQQETGLSVSGHSTGTKCTVCFQRMDVFGPTAHKSEQIHPRAESSIFSCSDWHDDSTRSVTT